LLAEDFDIAEQKQAAAATQAWIQRGAERYLRTYAGRISGCDT
jgi:hypothetical protein